MMKNLLFLIAIVVMLASCDEETQDVINNPSSIVPGVEAKIDGTEWKADLFAGIDSANVLIISNIKNSDNSSIIISLPDPQVKTYQVGDTSSNVLVSYINTTQSVLPRVGASGQINITSYGNSLVSGTFNFTTDTILGDPISITEGKMTNVPVTQQ